MVLTKFFFFWGGGGGGGGGGWEEQVDYKGKADWLYMYMYVKFSGYQSITNESSFSDLGD